MAGRGKREWRRDMISNNRRRRGIRSLLTRDSLGLCGEAENGKQAFEKVRELKLDLVILNVSMPVMNGIEAAREIRRFAPRSKIDG